MYSGTEDIDEVIKLVEIIKPFLAHRDPQIVGATLAELTSIFIVCHHPEIRNEILSLHEEMVRNLIPINEAKDAQWVQEK